MFLTNLNSASEWFQVLQTTRRSKTAVMNLPPGTVTDSELEVPPRSDQVLLVMDGEVTAEIAEETAHLRKGDIVVIPAGVRHRFYNESKITAHTMCVYAPPAYARGVRG